ncbi:MAG: DUF3883 domain-containing protein [Bacteroidetes bacterium]|nr:DUF3883 domain-containing protein [Bacteroidota bacterium]
MNQDWTTKEVNLIVKDYFNMLQLELRHQRYNKASHRRFLFPLLNNRSEGSVEFKHQNISAALIKMGLPFIKGYKPRFNYQKQILEKSISEYIMQHRLSLEKDFERFSESIIINEQSKSKIDFSNIVDEEPAISVVNEDEPLYRPIKINYLKKEQNNQKLGEEGEKLVLEYEKWSLIHAGRSNLADKVKWISKDSGDGTGFDILSKTLNGRDKFIEVKTTKLSRETPIYLTKNELSFSLLKERDFYLYRVFNFDTNPQIFIRNGHYNDFCKLEPQSYKGFFI